MAERVVLLNGTSSAGKTTIARGLQRTEPGWLFLEFDLFVQMLTEVAPTAAPTATPEPAGEELGRWLADAWYRALTGLAAAGSDLVVEDVIVERYRLDAAVRHLAPSMSRSLRCVARSRSRCNARGFVAIAPSGSRRASSITSTQVAPPTARSTRRLRLRKPASPRSRRPLSEMRFARSGR